MEAKIQSIILWFSVGVMGLVFTLCFFLVFLLSRTTRELEVQVRIAQKETLTNRAIVEQNREYLKEIHEQMIQLNRLLGEDVK